MPHSAAPVVLPADARAALAALEVPMEDLRILDKPGLARPVTRLGAAGVVVEIAESDEGRTRIQREVWGRDWARRSGLSTAEIHASDQDGRWLVGEWVAAATPSGSSFLDAAMKAAELLAAAEPPENECPVSVWRSPRRTALVRTARAVTAGMPMRLWWAARAAARDLPTVPVAHNDFYHRNVLWRPDRGEVAIVDWEYLAPGPKYGDLLRMWTVLPARADRDALLDRILTRAPASDWTHIATLGLWLALRLLGENIKAPTRDQNQADLTHAWSVQAEARTLARTYNAWPE